MKLFSPTKKHLIIWLVTFILGGIVILVVYNRGEGSSVEEFLNSITIRNVLEAILLAINSFILSYFISLVLPKDNIVAVDEMSAVQIGDMVKVSYNKLVRDLIPEHLASNGVDFKTHIADDTEYEDKLFAKLQEEVSELAKDKNIDEVADVLEVVDAIVAYKGFSKKEYSFCNSATNVLRLSGMETSFLVIFLNVFVVPCCNLVITTPSFLVKTPAL